MKYLKILGLCLVAVALSVVAVASASAAELEIVKAGTTEPLTKKKFSGESTGKAILETAKNGNIECTKTRFTGEVEGTKAGTANVTFEGCEAFKLFKCNSSGESAGVIKTSLSLGLVFGGGGVLLLLTRLPLATATVTLECTSIQKLIIRHGIVVLAEKAGGGAIGLKEKSKVLRIHPKQTKGAQELTKFKKTSTGAEETIFLETEGVGGFGGKTFAFEKSGEEASATEGKFEEEFEIIEK